MKTLDISGDSARQTIVAAGTEEIYNGHPTTLLMPDGHTMFCVWTYGHGGNCGPIARSDDGGLTWTRIDDLMPEGFHKHYNCPSIYRMVAPDGTSRIWIFSARPDMARVVSEDDGKTWNEMPPLGLPCVMAFSSIVQLANGSYLGMYHLRNDGAAGEAPGTLPVVAQCITDDGGLTWSNPVAVADGGERLHFCEPCAFRSPNGKELCCILRENARRGNSYIMFSNDEGKTWTEPRETQWEITGDRHQAIAIEGGRVLLVFRDMAKGSASQGCFTAWLGKYSDLKLGAPGQCRVKLLHNYASWDSGYPGLARLPDGTVVATTYVKLKPGKIKHSVVCVRFTVQELDGATKGCYLKNWSTPASVSGLRAEHRDNPLGLAETKPRLSWMINDGRLGAKQTAYRVVAASSPEKLYKKPDLWDSGKVRGDAVVDVVWNGKKLHSRDRVFWRVRVWDMDGVETEWSPTAHFAIGLLSQSDWSSAWIGRKSEEGRPSPYLRRSFKLSKGVAHASVHVAARGVFELSINGKRVGEDIFAPGWTDYDKRIQASTYDVTGLLRGGENAIGAVLGDGWYAGRIRGLGKRFWYGEQLSLLVQLEIDHDDGSRTVIAGDKKWKTSTGPILNADFYDGETYDARLEMPGWNGAGFNDSVWTAAKIFPAPGAKIVPSLSVPIRKQMELRAAKMTEPQPGVYVFDLGQNMVGWTRVKLRQDAGRKVTLRFAEMLNNDGTLYTANLRTAKCTDSYICKGGGEETYTQTFTFHGFRYVELSGLEGSPEIGDVAGIVLCSDMQQTGEFISSVHLVNRLQDNIAWGQRGNFLDIPTDCPQRDERLGWTGDAQIFAPTSCFNMDVSAFFTKWCVDLDDAQNEDGAYTHVAPDVYKGDAGTAGYGDAGVVCPWTIYLHYGDKAILERHYDAMSRWVKWREDNSPGLINSCALYGDWLSIDGSESTSGWQPTPRDLIATAYFAYTTQIMAKVAKILGRKADATRFTRLAQRVRKAFNNEFVSPKGRLAGDTQTGYLLALGFDLLPEGPKRKYALARLVKDIENRGVHLSTGFIGTPLLAPVLSRYGRSDIACKLLLQTSYPSWLYPVLQGATTMWERWNSYTIEGGFGNAGMNSFNHYAYGAIGEWMYSTLGGIAIDERSPGYRNIIMRPYPGEGFTSARASLLTRYGRASCAWRISDNGVLAVDIVVPANASATLVMPGSHAQKELAAGTYHFETKNWAKDKQLQKAK